MFFRVFVLFIIALLHQGVNSKAVETKTTKLNWKQQSERKDLLNYKATLLDEKSVPFLETCYNSNCCEDGDYARCAFYFSAVEWLKVLNYSGNQTNFKDIGVLLPPSSIDTLCNDAVKLINQMESSGQNISSDVKRFLSDHTRCSITCGIIKGDTTLARELCVGSVRLAQVAAAFLKHKQQLAPKPGVKPDKNSEKAEDGNAGELAVVVPPPPPQINKNSKDNALVEEGPIARKPEPKITKHAEAESKSPEAKLGDNQSAQEQALVNSVQLTNKKVAESGTPTKEIQEIPDFPTTVSNKTATKSTTTQSTQDAEQNENVQLDNSEFEDPGDDEDASLNDGKSELTNVGRVGGGSHNSQMSGFQSDSVQKPDSEVLMIRPDFRNEPSSNFFFYFLFAMFACILAYVVYNNKSKIFALILEGRRSHSSRGGRRKHTAAYRKLDTNLEEAITSTAPSGRTSQIIY